MKEKDSLFVGGVEECVAVSFIPFEGCQSGESRVVERRGIFFEKTLDCWAGIASFRLFVLCSDASSFFQADFCPFWEKRKKLKKQLDLRIRLGTFRLLCSLNAHNLLVKLLLPVSKKTEKTA